MGLKLMLYIYNNKMKIKLMNYVIIMYLILILKIMTKLVNGYVMMK